MARKFKFDTLFSGLDERGLEGQQMTGGLYGHRSNSSASSSPPAATSGAGQTGLVVPQPINAAAKGGQGGGGGGGQSGAGGGAGHQHSHTSNGSSGRKYQCKMCPQVGKVNKGSQFFLGAKIQNDKSNTTASQFFCHHLFSKSKGMLN